MAVATVSDVEVELGRTLSETESAQASVWLDRVERQIVKRLGPVVDLDQGSVQDVETMAVAAKLSNPLGAEYEAIDDYRYGLPKETRQVTILPEWWNLLDPDVGSGVFSARPYFVVDDSPIASLDWS